MKKNLILIAAAIMALCSCSKGGEYVDAIPASATALVAIDGSTPLLSDIEGIDTSKTTYLFETASGDMGLCAQGTDGDPLITFLPSSTIQGQEHQNKMIDKMKECDPENSIRKSQLWQHLQEVGTSKSSGQTGSASMRIVAQTNTLPKQLQACLTLGAPKGTDPADVLMEGELTYSDVNAQGKGTLTVTGHTCSYNEMVKQKIGSSMQIFKPITFAWEKTMDNTKLLGIMMNVEGSQFMPLLQSNKALNMMLMGTSAYDHIRENHGNMAVIGTTENSWNVQTNVNADAGTGTKEKLVLCLNMESLPKPLAEALGFLTGKINKIVYKVE